MIKFFVGLAFFAVVFAGKAIAGGGPSNIFYGDPTPPGPFYGPSGGGILPSPSNVPGKNFSINQNTNFAGNLETGRSLAWDGLGGTKDLFVYTNPSGTPVEIDALAGREDALYSEVITNRTFLLLSFQGDQGFRSIYAISPSGAISLWSTDDGVMNPPTEGFDLNGLDLWGTELTAANRFSPVGDASGSVLDVETGVVYTRSQIAAAIGRPDLETQVDIDGLMTSGNDILFSIQPIAGAFDGGEIWSYTGMGPGTASFLNFAGETWDTTFNLQNFFQGQGFNIGTENIDALEAASVPAPLPVVAAAAIFSATKNLRRLSRRLKLPARTEG